MKKKFFSLSKIISNTLLMFTVSALTLISCVDAELYDIYEDDSNDNIFVRNKKSKNDSPTVYQWTCFIVTPVFMKGNSGLYTSELDEFMRNKRNNVDVDFGSGINDQNRDYFVHAIFGSQVTINGVVIPSDGPRNSASVEEVKQLLTKIVGYNYDYHPCTDKQQIIAFIHQIQENGYYNDKGKHKTYDDSDFAIRCSVSTGNIIADHVAKFYDNPSGDIVIEPQWAHSASYTVLSYTGVFFPN